jgi:transcriptional regulator with XRE-family HTH domain
MKNPIVDPIDLAVGARLRFRRHQLDISQQAVAKACGVSFQQVQKYERGSNRISCSMLHRIAALLEVSPAFFFPDTVADDSSDTLKELVELAAEPGAMTLLRAVAKLPYSVRVHFIGLAHACHVEPLAS